MLTELFITVLVLMGLVTLRFGLPFLMMWLMGKALRYAQATLP